MSNIEESFPTQIYNSFWNFLKHSIEAHHSIYMTTGKRKCFLCKVTEGKTWTLKQPLAKLEFNSWITRTNNWMSYKVGPGLQGGHKWNLNLGAPSITHSVASGVITPPRIFEEFSCDFLYSDILNWPFCCEKENLWIAICLDYFKFFFNWILNVVLCRDCKFCLMQMQDNIQ